ncbi:MAG TPA: hypothetical protein P5081_11200 [Phycisphaerae bacterium]|nr:hypothetical protein [Phycisphaerae bacterium]HRW53446.1 hypothetical protein [Phycisphaerae bacterium]
MNTDLRRTDHQEDANPIGYCPHCDYQLLAPGVCPECGLDIPAKRVLARARRDRRWRRIRRAFVATIAVISVVCLRYAYRQGYLYRIYTNDMLINEYPTNSMATGELLRRMIADGLTPSEMEIAVSKSFNVGFHIRTPRPRDIGAACEMTITPVINGLFRIDTNDFTADRVGAVTLDALVVRHSLQSFDVESGGRNQAVRVQRRGYPAPTVGEHQFRWRAQPSVLSFDPALDAAMTSRPPVRLVIDESTTVEVTDKTICEFLRCRDSDEDVAHLRNAFRLLPKRSSRSDTIQYDVDAPHLDAAQTFNFSINEYSGDRDVGALWTQFNIPAATFIPQFESITRLQIRTGVEKHVCRLSYDLSQVFEDGADSVYPFALEWDVAHLSTSDAESASWGDEFNSPRSPDRIIRLDDTNSPDHL